MTILEITCRRHYLPKYGRGNGIRAVVWFWRVEHGTRQDAYKSIIMSPEPRQPRPGDHGMYGRIDPRLGLGQRD